jgi:calcium-dependent protein kinase
MGQHQCIRLTSIQKETSFIPKPTSTSPSYSTPNEPSTDISSISTPHSTSLLDNLTNKFGDRSLCMDIRKLYKFKTQIGTGHFGSVRTAFKKDITSLPNPTLFAIKSINLKNVNEKDIIEITREIDNLSVLKHPNIIHFYETYFDNRYFHIVMQLCKGNDLYEKIQSNIMLPEHKVKCIIFKLLHAIAYCHSKNIVHRDLKPENILFENDNDDDDVMITDFGLSKQLSHEQEILSSMVGTPYYMAPEVLKCSYSCKCDIWSIGIICYFALSGELPFTDKQLALIFKKITNEQPSYSSSEWQRVSHEAIEFVKLCLIKTPEQRPSALELLRHKWFDDVYKSNIHNMISYEQQRKILFNIKTFKYVNHLQILSLLHIARFVSDNDKQQIKEMFFNVNKSQNGKISKCELQTAFKLLNVDENESVIDNIMMNINKFNNENNVMEYNHFVICGMERKKYVNDDNVKELFKYFDINEDEFITKDDIEMSFKRDGVKMLFGDSDSIITLILNNDDKITYEQFKMFFNVDE